MNRMRRVPLPEGQAELLEMIAKGFPLKQTLARLTLLIEAQSEGLFCSILLLDEDGVHIHPSAGPHMPQVYMDALEGYAIGPTVGSCGTAMYKKETVVVTDILHDPLWAPYKQLLEPHGFRACWSTPIFLDQDTVLGSFAMYYREVSTPGPVELELMSVARHIAGIAIERKRSEEALRRYQHELEGLVQARTAELNLEKEKAVAAAIALQQSNQDLATAFDTLSATQEELVRTKKLAALGSLVAGVAHKLNTPIGNCTMASSSLLDQANHLRSSFAENQGLKRSDLVHFLDDVASAQSVVQRNLRAAANLVNTFKEIAADPIRANRRIFSLDELIAQLVDTLKPRLARSSVEIVQDVDKALQCDSYPDSIAHVLGNLIDNALTHAFEGRAGGRITLRARAQQNDMVELSVQDNGSGIPAIDIDKIFDPFFTTKLGTGCIGLGLNIVHNIVTGVLGGHIKADSNPEQGTVITISIPRSAPLLADDKLPP
jgi:signal transduction histidine kinase